MKVLELTPENDVLRTAFTGVAQEVYRSDPIWEEVSEIEFTTQWGHQIDCQDGLFQPVLVMDKGRPVSRAVAILRNKAVDETGAPMGYIGFFECLEGRPDAARAALEHCEHLLLKNGAFSVLAPKVDNQLFGCQIDRFDLPHVCLTPHNPPYYREYFEAAGYKVHQHIYSLYFTRETVPGPLNFTLPGFTTREFDPSHLEEESALFHSLQPQVFGDRPGYIPRSLAEDRAMIDRLLPFIDAELIIIAEKVGFGPVGILVCLPDHYQILAGRTADRVRVISIGILPAYVKKGIGTLMGAHLMRNLLRKKQYLFAEASLVLAHNIAPQALATKFPARSGRAFVVFEKHFK